MRSILVTLVVLAAAAPAIADTPPADAQAQGHADRVAFETWIQGLSGDERAGADYWAGQRSLPKPVPCWVAGAGKPSFTHGCQDALHHLATADIRRRSESEYKVGWNLPVSAGDVDDATPPAVKNRDVKVAAPCENVLILGIAASSLSFMTHIDRAMNAGGDLAKMGQAFPFQCDDDGGASLNAAASCRGFGVFAGQAGRRVATEPGYVAILPWYLLLRALARPSYGHHRET